jgi:CheY-like chemotaxis protein
VTTEPARFPILIVDDDEPTQNLLRAVLRRCGYTCDVASNGGQAIALLREKPFAAVVLDMMMPEVSGYEVIAHLATAENAVPVIICSAAGPRALAGVDPSVVKAIVRKPFDIDQLIAAVSAVTHSAE